MVNLLSGSLSSDLHIYNLQARIMCVYVCDVLFTLVVRFTHTCTITAIQWTLLPSSLPSLATLCFFCLCLYFVSCWTDNVESCVCVSVCYIRKSLQATIKHTHIHTHTLNLTPMQRVVDKLRQTQAKKRRDLNKYEFWRDRFQELRLEVVTEILRLCGRWDKCQYQRIWSNRNCLDLSSLRSLVTTLSLNWWQAIFRLHNYR